jgi:YD repeat-containing protein
MADAFISYARSDQEFARQLHEALGAAGHSLWADWDNIHPSSDWFEEISQGIAQSDAVIFIVTRVSAESKECRAELAYAQRAGIRIVPVLRERVDPRELPPGVGAFQWIEFVDDAKFDDSVGTLRRALETDLDWVRDHTRLRLRALEWDREGRRHGRLLNRSELREAEDWGRRSGEQEDRRPSQLIYDYLAASVVQRRRLQALTTGAVSVALVVAAGLAVWALLERGTAREQERLAISRELSASSLLMLQDDPELSVLLATEAAKIARTQQAEDALRRALSDSRTRLVIRGHRKDLRLARYSPDGRRVVTASDDNTARLWDAGAGQERAVLRGHALPLGGAEWSDDGSRVLTHAQDFTTRVYDGGDGDRVSVLRDPNDNRITSASFSPDGDRVVTTTFINTAYIWDSERGKILYELPGDDPSDAQFSSNGRLVVTGHQTGLVRLWRASDGKRLLVRRVDPQDVFELELSQDGKHLLTTSFEGAIAVWSFPTMELEGVPVAPDNVRREAVLSNDGSMVAAAEPGGAARVWTTAGEELATLTGHDGPVNEVRFDPTGRYVVTAGEDASALVWEIETERVVARLDGHRAGVTTAEFSPDGRTVLTSSLDDTARVWDPGTADIARALRPPAARSCGNAIFSPDGERIAAAGCGRSTYIFDASGRVLRRLPGRSGDFDTLQFSGRRRYLADQGFDLNSRLRIYDAAAGKVVLTGHEFETVGAFSPDEMMVLVESADAGRVVDLAMGREVAQLKPGTYGGGAAFSADHSRLYTGSTSDDLVFAWELPSGKRVARFRAPALQRESAFAQGIKGNAGVDLSEDARRLLAVHTTGSVRLIDTSSGRTLRVITGSEAPDQRMFSGATAIFSPDERRIVTAAGWDSLVRVWDAATGEIDFQIEAHPGGVSSVKYDSAGRLLATTSYDNTIRIWSATSGDSLVVVRDAQNGQLSPDGRNILTGGERARLQRCEVCGDLDDLLALADRRVTRPLSRAERERYLHE